MKDWDEYSSYPGWYSNREKVKKVIVNNGVTRIGDEAFRYCSSLTSIILPNGVTSIGWYSFYSCISLTSITIPDEVTRIDENAFDGCKKLKIYCKSTSYAKHMQKKIKLIMLLMIKHQQYQV